MSKITRLSVDELAKKMPKIEQKEQTECLGGTYAFNYEGAFLGRI